MSAADDRPTVSSIAPAAAEQLRRHNTALLLRTLRDSEPVNRADLAKRTGLAKATVSTIVARLDELGAVREQDTTTPPRGRPSRRIALDGERIVGLGLEVNVDYVAAVALDLSGRTVLLDEHPIARGADALSGLHTLASTAVKQLHAEDREVLGVTVAVPGLVDRARGHVSHAPNLGWRDLDLATELGRTLGGDLTVNVDNDANCAALAEVSRGAARGVRDVLYLTGTVGVGGGIVVDGRLLRGSRGYAGEVGHMNVGTERTCACGRTGCWEAVVGLHAMLDSVGFEVDRAADPVAIAEQVAAVAPSEPRVRDGLSSVAHWLARGAGMLANALNPELIVLGGYFVPLGPWLAGPLESALQRDVFVGSGCRVALSELGLQAASTGAAAAIIDEIYDARIALPG